MPHGKNGWCYTSKLHGFIVTAALEFYFDKLRTSNFHKPVSKCTNTTR